MGRERIADNPIGDPVDRASDKYGTGDRRFQRRDKQAMIGAREDTSQGPRRITTYAIRDYPFATQPGIEIARNLPAEGHVRRLQALGDDLMGSIGVRMSREI